MTGSDFRKWRRSQEITQQEIADLIHCSKAAICRWEKGNLVLADILYDRVLEIYNAQPTKDSVEYQLSISDK